jgi:hypothetical protein
MPKFIDRVFLEHPAKVDETYTEHLVFAWQFGLELIAAGVAALTHALVPCLFERTASTAVKRLHSVIQTRSASATHAVTDDPLAYI